MQSCARCALISYVICLKIYALSAKPLGFQLSTFNFQLSTFVLQYQNIGSSGHNKWYDNQGDLCNKQVLIFLGSILNSRSLDWWLSHSGDIIGHAKNPYLVEANDERWARESNLLYKQLWLKFSQFGKGSS